jgi:hypothetical protein
VVVVVQAEDSAAVVVVAGKLKYFFIDCLHHFRSIFFYKFGIKDLFKMKKIQMLKPFVKIDDIGHSNEIIIRDNIFA